MTYTSPEIETMKGLADDFFADFDEFITKMVGNDRIVEWTSPDIEEQAETALGMHLQVRIE